MREEGGGGGGEGYVMAEAVAGDHETTSLSASSNPCLLEEESDASKKYYHFIKNNTGNNDDDVRIVSTNYKQRRSLKSHKNPPLPVVSSVSSVVELLECPVCTNSMYPPIFQCHNGHTICSKCKTKVQNQCPTCRRELGNIRCLALEMVAESLELPCEYSSLGCADTLPYYYKIKHEECCSFRPYTCPYAGSECSTVGDIPCLISHLVGDHKVDMHSGHTFNHRYVKANAHEVVNATWMLTVFNCFGEYFCLHFESFELGETPVYMAFIRFMGDEAESRKFRYSLEVGGKGRKMTWQGIPRSIRDSHQRVRDSLDGLIIQKKMALVFSGGDRKELKLRVTGKIWREQQEEEVT